MSRWCTPGLISAVAEEEGWSSEAREVALKLAATPPRIEQYRVFLDRVLLGLGVVGLLTGVICFVGAHWSSWGRWGQILLVGLLLCLSGGAALRWGLKTRVGGWALVLASGCLGGLLALICDEFFLGEEFCLTTWTLLLLPPTWLSTFGPQWVLWLLVANLTGLNVMGDATEEIAVQGLLNGVFWGLSLRFRPRLGWTAVPAWVSLLEVTGAAVSNLMDQDGALGLVCWLLVAAGSTLYAWPRRHRGILAGAGFSAVVLLTTLLARNLDWGSGTFLFIGLAVVVQVAFLLEGLRRMSPAEEEKS